VSEHIIGYSAPEMVDSNREMHEGRRQADWKACWKCESWDNDDKCQSWYTFKQLEGSFVLCGQESKPTLDSST